MANILTGRRKIKISLRRTTLNQVVIDLNVLEIYLLIVPTEIKQSATTSCVECMDATILDWANFFHCSNPVDKDYEMG